MFNFGNSDTARTYAALIDISSGSIGVALIVTSASQELPKLLYSHRIHMRITEYNAVKHDDLRRVREALLSACLILSQEGYPVLIQENKHAKISKIFVTCSSPWSYMYLQNVQYENDIRFKISNSIIDDLVKSALEEISNNLKNNELFNENSFDLIEQLTTDYLVNDYPVANAIGLSGTTVSLSHIVGLIPSEISKSIAEVNEKLFKNADATIHSFVYIAHNVIKDVFKNVHNACIININGESSEFAIIENDVLHKNIHENYGVNSFVRDIMQKTGKPQSDILSSMHAYIEGTHNSNDEIQKYVELYATNISKTLKTIFDERQIPKEIFVIVSAPHEKIFKEIISIAIKTVTNGAKHIILLDSNVLEHLISGSTDDISIALCARFFHTSNALSLM